MYIIYINIRVCVCVLVFLKRTGDWCCLLLFVCCLVVCLLVCWLVGWCWHPVEYRLWNDQHRQRKGKRKGIKLYEGVGEITFFHTCSLGPGFALLRVFETVGVRVAVTLARYNYASMQAYLDQLGRFFESKCDGILLCKFLDWRDDWWLWTNYIFLGRLYSVLYIFVNRYSLRLTNPDATNMWSFHLHQMVKNGHYFIPIQQNTPIFHPNIIPNIMNYMMFFPQQLGDLYIFMQFISDSPCSILGAETPTSVETFLKAPTSVTTSEFTCSTCSTDRGEVIPSYMSRIERNGGGSGTLSQRNPTKPPKVQTASSYPRFFQPCGFGTLPND